jgi:hypothetical protein
MAKAMPFASLSEAFAVATEHWRGQHRKWVFSLNGDSVARRAGRR